jgi:hypothetical protein
MGFLFNKLCILTNLCKQCPYKTVKLNSQLLPQQGCLDLQMPEKLDPIFEYRQTWPPSLTVKQNAIQPMPTQQLLRVIASIRRPHLSIAAFSPL